MLGAASAQQDFSDVEIRTTQLTSRIYMLEGSGGNIGVSVGQDGILMIDDQFEPLAGRIKSAINAIGGGGELKYVLNTHWHGDHTGGNAVFAELAPIIAHDNVRTRLSNSTPAVEEGALPVITFDQSMSIYFNGEEIRAMHYPHSHTDGDIALYFTESNVAHLGDQFFPGRFPFIDTNSGGSLDGLIQNIRQIIEQLPDDVQIIPGHGPLSSHEDLVAYERMLTTTSSIVRQQINAGRTLSQIQASGLLAEWSSWGEGFISTDRWIETIYRNTDA